MSCIVGKDVLKVRYGNFIFRQIVNFVVFQFAFERNAWGGCVMYEMMHETMCKEVSKEI